MRNLAFAVVAIEPEAILGVSFQLSFAAVAALVALMEARLAGLEDDPDPYLPQRGAAPRGYDVIVAPSGEQAAVRDADGNLQRKSARAARRGRPDVGRRKGCFMLASDRSSEQSRLWSPATPGARDDRVVRPGHAASHGADPADVEEGR
jgi:hypothetical protein